MKLKYIISSLLVLCSIGMFSQVDRTTPPEAGPAPRINLEKPSTFTLKNGLTVMVVENRKLPRVSMTLTLDNPPVKEEAKTGVSGVMGAMLGEGTSEIPKDKFNEELDYLGARVNFFSSGATANTLSKYFPEVMELMAQGALDPLFTQEELEKQKDRSLENIRASQKDVAQNAQKISRALSYGKNHPYGEFPTEETIKSLTLDDIENYYSTYFVPNNAYLVVVGDVKTKEVKELATEFFNSWKKSSLPEISLPETRNAQHTEINFIDFPNAVQSEILITNIIDLEKGDPDYFAALLANKILGGGGEARLFLNLREDKGYTYGAYSSTTDDKYVGRFVASASVRNTVTDSAVTAFLDELHRIRNEKVSPEELKNAKAKYTGDFVLALENPSTIARYALNIETHDLPEDFYQKYLEEINAVTAEDIQRAANKHFLIENARIIIAGKGSEVASKLEDFHYDGKEIQVKYFDKQANEVEKPDFEGKVPKDVTASKVFDRYFQAIGGEDALKGVESVRMLAEASIQGQEMSLESIVTASGQNMQQVSMGGNVIQKQVFDGENGFVSARGQQIPFTEEQKEAAKLEGHPFPEYLAQQATVTGMEEVDGQQTYAVSVNGNITHYYSIESGLKLRTVKTMTQGNQTLTVPILYKDYREVDGVQFPFLISQSMGPMTLDFEVKEIKINEEVNISDFQ